MKHLLFSFFALLLSLTAAAQVPQSFSYQAVLRNSNGALVNTRQVGVRISILQGSATGTAVYVETHTPTTNANGLMNLYIGQGTFVSGSFLNIAWGTGNFYLKTETDPVGGTNYTITGTTQLLTVPYAMHAQTSDYAQTSNYALRAGGHYIGELFGGGIIFSLWRDHLGVEHGLIASLDDLAISVFANPGILTNSVGASVDNGASNTAAIVAVLGANANTAAGVCDSYVSGSFTDWYLPAVMELNLLYTQAVVINAVLNNDNNPLTNGFSPSNSYNSYPDYWSSSLEPANAYRVITQAFGVVSNGREFYSQTDTCRVRAIRRF